MTTEQKLELAIKTLEFYAAKDKNVCWDSGCGCCIADFDAKTNPVFDAGEKATETLNLICPTTPTPSTPQTSC